MICKRCGSEVSENLPFCPICGHTLQQQGGARRRKGTIGGIVGIVLLIGVGIFVFGGRGKGDSQIATAQYEVPQTIPTAPPTIQEQAPMKTPIVTEKPNKDNAPPKKKAVDTKPYETYYVTNCYERITLRKSDSTKAEKICSIPLGAPVSYVGNAKDGFCKVIYDGRTGYALASYLTSDVDKIVSGDKLVGRKSND